MTDVLTADIHVEAVEPKEGVSASGKPWKLYAIKAADGTRYSTFDGALGSSAFGAVGRRAHITFKATEKGRDLMSITVDESSEPHVEPVRDRDQNGNADWDLIGLRKTRCALWVAAIGAGLEAGVARQLVIAAEVDIFHRAPADELGDVPF